LAPKEKVMAYNKSTRILQIPACGNGNAEQVCLIVEDGPVIEGYLTALARNPGLQAELFAIVNTFYTGIYANTVFSTDMRSALAYATGGLLMAFGMNPMVKGLLFATYGFFVCSVTKHFTSCSCEQHTKQVGRGMSALLVGLARNETLRLDLIQAYNFCVFASGVSCGITPLPVIPSLTLFNPNQFSLDNGLMDNILVTATINGVPITVTGPPYTSGLVKYNTQECIADGDVLVVSMNVNGCPVVLTEEVVFEYYGPVLTDGMDTGFNLHGSNFATAATPSTLSVTFNNVTNTVVPATYTGAFQAYTFGSVAPTGTTVRVTFSSCDPYTYIEYAV
jgi:hypothetical protein